MTSITKIIQHLSSMMDEDYGNLSTTDCHYVEEAIKILKSVEDNQEIPFKELIAFYDGKKIRMNKGQGGMWYAQRGFRKVRIKLFELSEGDKE
jgi:hypothetical protein